MGILVQNNRPSTLLGDFAARSKNCTKCYIDRAHEVRLGKATKYQGADLSSAITRVKICAKHHLCQEIKILCEALHYRLIAAKREGLTGEAEQTRSKSVRSTKNARRLKNCAKHYTTDCSQRSEKVSGEAERDSEHQSTKMNQKYDDGRYEIASSKSTQHQRKRTEYCRRSIGQLL